MEFVHHPLTKTKTLFLVQDWPSLQDNNKTCSVGTDSLTYWAQLCRSFSLRIGTDPVPDRQHPYFQYWMMNLVYKINDSKLPFVPAQ